MRMLQIFLIKWISYYFPCITFQPVEEGAAKNVAVTQDETIDKGKLRTQFLYLYAIMQIPNNCLTHSSPILCT